MAKRTYDKVRRYLYLIPVLFLFAFGVLWRTTKVPSTQAQAAACGGTNGLGMIDITAKSAFWQGRMFEIPQQTLAMDESETQVLGVADPAERWVEVDLSDQKLRAWDGDVLFLETAISSGLPGTPTPKGEFRVWMKIRATKMEGGQGSYYYNLPNVPYVMFFGNDEVDPYKGYGLHGTYWHNDFGTPRSHGCVNLPTSIAKMLYEWTTPQLPDGKNVIRASEGNEGTRIVIHE